MAKRKRKRKSRLVDFPDNCQHRAFFSCKKPNKCLGCYYNPIKADAYADKEPDEKKIWFYSSKKHVKACLQELSEIKKGKGLCRGGTRCYFKYAKREFDD